MSSLLDTRLVSKALPCHCQDESTSAQATVHHFSPLAVRIQTSPCQYLMSESYPGLSWFWEKLLTWTWLKPTCIHIQGSYRRKPMLYSTQGISKSMSGR